MTIDLKGVSIGHFAYATGRTIATILNWRDGRHAPPVYIDLTIEAVARKLKPVTHDRMYAHRLTDVLKVPKETEWTWRFNRHFPQAARLAVALVEWRDDRLTPYELQLMRQINNATYYRVTGGWRARPVMGRRVPALKTKTPLKLVARGFLDGSNGRLTITAKGKEAIK